MDGLYLLDNAAVSLTTTGDNPRVLEQKRTDKQGRFDFAAAPSGSYQLIVTLPNFRPYVRTVDLSRGAPSAAACLSPIQVGLSP